MKIGRQVVVTYPEPGIPEDLAEIVGGPSIRVGVVVWKVRTIEVEPLHSWVSETWMKPLLRAVEG